jgi:hypothetical protein
VSKYSTGKYLCCVLICLVKKIDLFEVTALLNENLRLIVYICVFVCVATECWHRLGQMNAYNNYQRPSHACFAWVRSVDTSTFLTALCSSNTGRVKAHPKPFELSDRSSPVLYRVYVCVCVRACLR